MCSAAFPTGAGLDWKYWNHCNEHQIKSFPRFHPGKLLDAATSIRRYASTPKRQYALAVGQILHAPPSGYDGWVADVFHQQVTELFREIQIFFGEKIEALDRLLA